MELLERVVRQHGPVDLLGNTQQERVAASDGAGRGMDVLAAQRGLLETGKLGGIDPVRERGVDDDGDLRVRMVAPELDDSVFQLFQARQGPALGGDVGSVDDDVLNGHVRVVKHPEPTVGSQYGLRNVTATLLVSTGQGRLGTSVWA